jgi:hypothetical protein
MPRSSKERLFEATILKRASSAALTEDQEKLLKIDAL